jgi:hypothetical protein
MQIKRLVYFAFAGAAMSLTVPASAATILIINGASGTSEPGTTSSITTQVSNLQTAAGNTVSVADSVPGDLSSFAQVFDLRFSNAFALTAPIITQYVSFLQGGGGLFVMGENSGFAARNNSILSLIEAAGGGTLTFTTPAATQTVVSPFNGPVPLSTVTFNAAGGVTGPGSGQFITTDGSAGSGVAFGVGTLSNARAGALTTIFDVNFLQTTASADNQALASNLVRFVSNEVGGVPEPATWAMMLLGFFGIGGMMRTRRTVSFAF